MIDEPHDLTLEKAVQFLWQSLATMEKQPRGDLDMDPDTAFEAGYRIAIHDLIRCTSPKPKGNK